MSGPGTGNPNPSLGAFQVVSRVAEGGMGEVWSGRHARTGAPVAIKLIRRDRLDAAARDEFEREIRAQARIDHPGVVYLLDHGRLDAAAAAHTGLPEGAPWLAMEHCSTTLRALAPGLSWRGVRAALLQLLDALAHAHAVGVLHRDIKLSNVLVATDRDLRPGVKLADFGIAHALGDDDEATRSVGTPRYMAPEQVVGAWHDHGPWTDLYALGVLAWRLVTGRVPWPRLQGAALARAMCVSPLGWPGSRFPVPDGAQAWIERLTAKRVAERFALAADARAALLELPEHLTQQRWLAAGLSMAEVAGLTLVPELEPDPPPEVHGAARVADPRDDPPPESEAAIQLHEAGAALLALRRPPFVGRRAARHAAWGLLRDVVRGGAPAALEVSAAPKMGRGRFLRWLSEAAERAGQAVTIAIRCDVSGSLEDAVRATLREWFRVGPLDRDEARAHLTGWLGHATDLDALLDLLERPCQDGTSWLATVSGALGALARVRPLIVRLTGVRWSTEAEPFARALLAEQGAPILVVVDSALAGAHRVQLVALSAAEQRRIVDALIQLEPASLDRLVERADGRPGLLHRTLLHWAERGLLRAGPRGFEVPADAPMPPTLAVVATAQLDAVLAALDAPGRASLERALVFGAAIDAATWRELDMEHDDRVRQRVLDTLAARGLLAGDPAGWRLASPELRAALLARLPAERSRAHHAACAEALARRAEPEPLLLGRHLLAGGRLLDALGYLWDGLERLTATQPDAAVEPLLARIEAGLQGLEGPARLRWTAMLAELYAGRRCAAGDPDGAEQDARRALRTAELLGDRELAARCWARLGEVAAARGADEERIACFARALDLASSASPARVATWWLGQAKGHLGRGDVLRWGACMAAAASTARAASWSGVRYVEGLGAAAQHQVAGAVDASLRCLDEAYRAAAAAGSVRGRFAVLRARGHTLARAARWSEASTAFDQALALARALPPERGPPVLANAVAVDLRLGARRQAFDRFAQHRYALPPGEDTARVHVPAHCAAIGLAGLRGEWRVVGYHLDRVEAHGRWSWASVDCSARLFEIAAQRALRDARPEHARRLARSAASRASREVIGAHPTLASLAAAHPPDEDRSPPEP